MGYELEHQAEFNLLRYVRNNPVRLVDSTGLSAKRYVQCTFAHGGNIWSETVVAYTSETSGQACERRAAGWGLFTAWTVIDAREGALSDEGAMHGGKWESDYADLRVTCNQCKENQNQTEETCRQQIGLRAGSLQAGQNLFGLAETAVGGGLIGAGVLMVKSGVGAPAGGGLLVASGIIVFGKGVYDIYVTGKIGQAALAAAERYCDCTAIIP